MAATEIEKLERRYAENPQGLTFAPLAEVHRKNGEVARALELLRAGLELHPNYIPASIVLGRCHWDQGDLPAAEGAFSHVLRLDDENVIALKSLADINERLERFGDAVRWLNRLISVDRSNEEARQQLARLEATRQQPAAAPAAAPAVPEPAPVEARHEVAEQKAAPAPVPAPAANLVEQKTAAEEKAAPEPQPDFPAAPEPKTASDPAGLELTADLAEPKSSELEFLEIPEPPASAGVEPNAGATSSPEETAPLAGLVSAEFVPPKDVSFRSHPELTHDFGASEPPDIEELEVETADEVELQSSGAAEFRVENAAEDFMDSVAAPAPMQREELELSPPPVYEIQPEPEPEPELASPPPAKPEPAQTPVPVSAEPRRSYSVRETRGQSVAAFFKTLLSARPAGPAAEGTDAAVSRRPPEEPVVAAQDTTVSFDDFFGAASGSTPAKQDEDPSKDDLDQFQSWLQNLKR